ncbi:GNAT family N-acetyltransferase [Streptomyces sp. NPDC005438]|uniref:GNAT family N-acetyltransferase n=1 Tax=Streptomyces sp. NPDC005438 TaxID=3156880 RepID=UPI0033B6726F
MTVRPESPRRCALPVDRLTEVARAGTLLEAGHFSLRPVRLEEDLSTVHRWMNDPVVARFWEMPHPPDRIAGHLRQQLASAHSLPFLGLLDGEPMSYWELYRADLDFLAEHYQPRPFDLGVHLLLGPSRFRGRGLGAAMLRTVAEWQLAVEPRAERVLAEPDVTNHRSVRAFERAGFVRVEELRLPDKRAYLMELPRRSGDGRAGQEPVETGG